MKVKNIILGCTLGALLTTASFASTSRPKPVVLYHKPGSVSLSSHITANESRLMLDLVEVDLQTHKTKSGKDYYKINPKGTVPAIKDGSFFLTESVAIMQYLADKDPEHNMLPVQGHRDRYKVLEALNVIAMNIYHNVLVLFHTKHLTDDAKKEIMADVKKNFSILDKQLDGKEYLVGNKFSIADAFLFNMLQVAPHLNLDISEWKNLHSFNNRVAQRPAVKKAMAEEKIA